MFPLFDNPLQLAHHYWRRLLTGEDRAIDATCGNGRDTAVLAGLAGGVEAWDIQEEAIRATRERTAGCPNVTCRLGCHSQLAKALSSPIALAIFNLGYLPGGDKGITTRVETTLEAAEALLGWLRPGGALSLVCYPGHPEGRREEGALLSWAEGLSQGEWCVAHHRFLNRTASPSLLLIQKIRREGSSSPR
ncbi:MAG: class I SAM-dependent methyltransferase [Parachlamydiales bacterium]